MQQLESKTRFYTLTVKIVQTDLLKFFADCFLDVFSPFPFCSSHQKYLAQHLSFPSFSWRTLWRAGRRGHKLQPPGINVDRMKCSALRFHRATSCATLLHSEAAISFTGLVPQQDPTLRTQSLVLHQHLPSLSSFPLSSDGPSIMNPGRTKKKRSHLPWYLSSSCSGPQQRTVCLFRIRSGKNQVTLLKVLQTALLLIYWAIVFLCFMHCRRSKKQLERIQKFMIHQDSSLPASVPSVCQPLGYYIFLHLAIYNQQ